MHVLKHDFIKTKKIMIFPKKGKCYNTIEGDEM